MAVIDVLEGGLVFESGAPQAVGGAPVVALSELPVDEQAEAFLEGQGVDIGQGHLLGEGGGHPGALQGAEFVQGRMCQHGALLLWVSGNRPGHGCCRGPRAGPTRSARPGVGGRGRGGGWIRYSCSCDCPG